MGLDLQFPVLSRNSLPECDHPECTALRDDGVQFRGASGAANVLLLFLSRGHTGSLEIEKQGEYGFGTFSAVRSEIRRPDELFSQHARFGGDADSVACVWFVGSVGICLSGFDCAVVHVYETALYDQPSIWCSIGMVGVSNLFAGDVRFNTG